MNKIQLEVGKTYAFRELDPDTINHYYWISWKYVWPWKQKKYQYWRADYGYHESNKFSELSKLTERDNVQ